MRTVVYFIQEGSDGPIKIGYTSNLKKRLESMQVGNSKELNVLGTYSGGRKEESYLHSLFAIAQIRGEWYYPIHELLKFIRLNCSNHSVKGAQHIDDNY